MPALPWFIPPASWMPSPPSQRNLNPLELPKTAKPHRHLMDAGQNFPRNLPRRCKSRLLVGRRRRERY
jgi:hypothetical protein